MMQTGQTCSCHYHNGCPRPVILRCRDSEVFYLEKVIVPLADWCFDSPPDSRVEIWSYGQGGVELLHILYARELVKSGTIDPRWGLDPQRLVRTDMSRRGLRDVDAGSQSTEVAVPC